MLITHDIMNFCFFLACISLKIATEWVNFEGSMLSEVNQSLKAKYCMISLI